MVATSATRDAENSQEFTDPVKDVLGVAPGGRLRRRGGPAVVHRRHRELVGTALGAEGACPPPYLVTDIGGGSTEFVLGGPEGMGTHGQVSGRSVNIGCVRLTERHLHGDPPTPHEVAAAIADIDAALDLAAGSIAVTEASTLVGLAGSVTTVAAIALGLGHYDSDRIHHSRVSAGRAARDRRRTARHDPRRAGGHPVMHPGRVDVIGAGALILDRIMTRFGFAEVLVSEHDILDGIAWSLVP